MTPPRFGRLALVGWVAVVAAVGAGLRWAGDGALAPPPLTEPGTWGAWLGGRGPVVAAIALLRLGALAGLWYLVAATSVGLILRMARFDGLVRVADRLTVAPVRRLLVAVVGLSFASGVSPALAVARATPAPAAVVYQLPTSTATTTTTTTTAASPPPPPTLTMRLLPSPADDPPVPADPVAAPSPAPAVPPPAGRANATTWTVQPGECFWSIAEDVLTRAWGRAPSDAEIVPYWRTLIERNRSLLADRTNPDLIFPAQVFTVPAPPPAT
ncbi:MAG: LysM peptidoglycan-binding domain-containing protein [Acidimicrobiales bacterium]